MVKFEYEALLSSSHQEQSTVSNLEKGAAGARLDTLFRMLAALDLEMVIRTKDEKSGWKEEW